MNDMVIIHCRLDVAVKLVSETMTISGRVRLMIFKCQCGEEIRIARPIDAHCSECKYYWVGAK